MPPPFRRPGPHRPHHPHPHPHPHPHRPGPHRPIIVPVPIPQPKPEPPPEPKFERLYHWENNTIVVIEHSLGKHLRVGPINPNELDYEGGTGELARWKTYIHENHTVIQFQSVKTGKFLRVTPQGTNFDVQGAPKGPNTYFIMEKLSTGVVNLKSKRTFMGDKHAYLAVQHGGVAQRRLIIKMEGLPRNWEYPYLFNKRNTIVIQHKLLQNLRSANHGHGLQNNGGTGAFAQWEADPDHNNNTVRFKNVKHGTYLRIIDHGKVLDCGGNGGPFTVFKVHHIDGIKNYVKLESVKFPGKFVAIDENGPRVGVGGPWCCLTLYRQT